MRKWLPLLTVSLGTFMLLVDVTIVNVALPDMAVDLKTSFSSLQWVVDAYALVLAALVLGTGTIADKFGHRRSYVVGLAVFAISSAICGVSPNVDVLITFRAIQGLGAAAMFATTFALLNSSYQGRDRGTAYGVWGAVAGASASIGPILGGLLTQGISWRWIFFVNVPVSVVVIALCVFVLVDQHAPAERRIDYAGMVTFTGFAGAATYAFIHANEHGWATGTTYALLAASVLFLIGFLVIESRVAAPMIELSLLRNRSFAGVLIAALILNFSAFAFLTYTSIWMQSVLHFGAIKTGLTGLPLSMAAFVVSAGIGRFLHGNRAGLIIGGGLIAVGAGSLLDMALLRTQDGWIGLLPGFVVAGIGVGLATPTLSSSAMSAVPVQRGGMASGAVNSMRQLGYAFGIALLGTVFAARANSSLTGRHVANADSVAHALAGGQAPGLLAAKSGAAAQQLNDALHRASLSGLHGTFLVAGVAGVLAGLVVLVMVKPAAPAPQQQPSASGEAALAH
ncbi:MFS transporter [Jatrophihabitans sp.]|uniref:MFS transporter n=1 Tax=Jatrophihabitans sp. TaxID=1932789 RepID=UPI0030C73776|nr:drug resistance transporter, EmrB/QacA subfamily [Jatrophihabitans sp.]